eukprot:258145_1
MDIEEPPLRRGHRNATEAEMFESSRSWRKAMYKHQEAAECFTECLGLTSHPQANRAILLLISKHKKRCEEIRDKLSYNKSIKNLLKDNGYNLNRNSPKINEQIYNDLRDRMQNIVSYSHKQILPSNPNSIVLHNASGSNQHKQQINEYLSKRDVRQSVNINIEKDDKSMNINKRTIVLNDNFFNPDHEETHSEKQLIESNQKLRKTVNQLQGQLKHQSIKMNEYQNEIQKKVTSLRQILDDLYSTSNPNHGKKNRNNADKDSERKMNDESDVNMKELMDGNGTTHKEIKKIIEDKVKEERRKWEKDKERLRNIHAKQLGELKKKLNGWMEYGKKQEQHAKVYKKQLLMQHKKNANNNHKGVKGQIYSRGTLSKAKKNAIPESQ